MILMDEYNVIMGQINDAFNDALKEVAEELLKDMRTAADEVVYSYPATPEAMQSRREEIGEAENFDVDYGDLSVTIKSTVVMQGTDYGVTEGDFVQMGLDNYKQPYERDFMWASLKKFADNGKIDNAIGAALGRHNIEATYTGGGYEISEDLVATRTLEV